MAQKKLAILLVTILFFTSCSSKIGIKTELGGAKLKRKGQGEAPQEILETVKSKRGTFITAKEAAAIQKINEITPGEDIFQNGISTWYGRRFHGKRTANGEIYDMHKMTAAHKTLPFNTLVEVENLDNGKRVIVRINDRGPFLKGRIIDLSYNAAKKLEFHREGVIPVALRIVNADTIYRSDIAIAMVPNLPIPKNKTPEKIVKKEIPEKVAAKEVGTPYISPPYISSRDTTPQIRFCVQTGAFSDKENAQNMLKNMKPILLNLNISFDVYFQNGMYKVISAPLPSQSRAEELQKALQEINIDAFVRKL